jgi:hypothetical protein
MPAPTILISSFSDDASPYAKVAMSWQQIHNPIFLGDDFFHLGLDSGEVNPPVKYLLQLLRLFLMDSEEMVWASARP